jgi:hypothetical protein
MVAKANRRGKVFISHAWADRDAARAVSSELREAGYDVFSAEDALPGDNLPLEVGKALQRSNSMVILLSPEWTSSPYSVMEMEYALGTRRFEGRVVPVVLRDSDDIPWILRRFELIRTNGASRVGRAVVARLERAAEVTAS